MPLVAHNNLPSFNRLLQEGASVLSPERAAHQDIRELHIGLLNMMPDAAINATERQFFRIIGESNQIAQFYVHPFTLPELERGPEAARHIEQHYESFNQICEQGLDALIITGANVSQPNLEQEPFWSPLIEVIDWAYENVTSALCSCLATHAVLQFKHNQKRIPLPQKKWGVYEHRVLDKTHPLVIDVNTRFDVPHSRFNEITREQFDNAGLHVLVEGEEPGVHLAVSEDLFRVVYFQGHPEYDTISLLKEYKREVKSFFNKKRNSYPVYPAHYFSLQQQALLEEYRHNLERSLKAGETMPTFPEKVLTDHLDNTWHDTAGAVINNWIGKVYQLTNNDRKLPFMDDIDPQDPLKLRV